MPKRLHIDDAQALMNIRQNLINDHERLLDGMHAPAMAVVKQADVSKSFAAAIKSLEEVLSYAADIEFKRTP